METHPLPRVFVLGSSLTIHFGPFLEKKLEGKFLYDRKRDEGGVRAADNLDYPQGASGGDSSMVLAYLRARRRSDPIPAEIILLSCGLHDIKVNPATGAKQVEPQRFEENLESILSECEAMNLAVAWLRVTPVIDELHNLRSTAFHRFNADVLALNEIADRIMTERGAKIIDLYSLCETLLPHSLIDHIHYDEAGRELQAAFIAGEIEEWWSSEARRA